MPSRKYNRSDDGWIRIINKNYGGSYTETRYQVGKSPFPNECAFVMRKRDNPGKIKKELWMKDSLVYTKLAKNWSRTQKLKFCKRMKENKTSIKAKDLFQHMRTVLYTK